MRRADPTKAVERLSSDDLAALARKPPSGKEPPTAQLTDDELQARTEMAVGGVTPAQYAKSAKEQLDRLTAKDHGSQVMDWWNALKESPTGQRDAAFGASFIKERTGERVDLKLMLGQTGTSSENRPNWVLYDITSPDTRDEYTAVPSRTGVSKGISRRSGPSCGPSPAEHPTGAVPSGSPGRPRSGRCTRRPCPCCSASEPNAEQRRKSPVTRPTSTSRR